MKVFNYNTVTSLALTTYDSSYNEIRDKLRIKRKGMFPSMLLQILAPETTKMVSSQSIIYFTTIEQTHWGNFNLPNKCKKGYLMESSTI